MTICLLSMSAQFGRWQFGMVGPDGDKGIVRLFGMCPEGHQNDLLR